MNKQWFREVAQVVQHLPSKRKALNSNLNTVKKKKEMNKTRNPF
jgi:uncharacterized protein (UPF0216 family)